MLNLTDIKKRRKDDREFKQMVVKLSNTREDISALAAEMDIRPDLIYRWRREAVAFDRASSPGQGNNIMTGEQKKIARLKKELRDDQLERDILKKAVSIFSRSDGKYSNSYLPAWKMAVRNRMITRKLIFHSDRGVQYSCYEFANLLSSYKLVERSMSRKGDCWDNAVAESFFKTLKVKHIYHHSYKTFKEAELSVFEYIELWYNVNRIHTTLKTSIRNKKEKFINQLVA